MRSKRQEDNEYSRKLLRYRAPLNVKNIEKAQQERRNRFLKIYHDGTLKLTADFRLAELALFLEENTDIKLNQLILCNCCFGAASVAKEIERIFTARPSLDLLDLQGNQIYGEKIETIAKILKSFKVKNLNLSNNKIEDDGVKILVEALFDHGTLSSLDLGYTYIGDEGAQFIAKFIENNHTLQVLNLRFNFIGDKGAKAILNALKNNQNIIHIDLNRNCISPIFLEEIKIKVNQNVETRCKFTEWLSKIGFLQEKESPTSTMKKRFF